MQKPPSGSCIFPGTFDPLTNGHCDVIQRALGVFDRIIVAVLDNPDKQPLLSLDERRQLITLALGNNPRITVDAFSGLLVDYARSIGVTTVVRGIRSPEDLHYEAEIAFMNRHLDHGVETLFLLADPRWYYVSSRLVRSALKAGASIEGMVPDVVYRRIAHLA